MGERSIHVAAAALFIASLAAIPVTEGDLRGAAIVSFLMSLYPVARTEMPAWIRGGLVAVAAVTAAVWYAGSFTVRAYAVVAAFALFLLGSLMNEDLRPSEGIGVDVGSYDGDAGGDC